MNDVVQGALITLVVFGLALMVWSLIGIAMSRSAPKPSTKWLRGFKYGDVVTLADAYGPYPAMILSVRIDEQYTFFPTEMVRVLRLEDETVSHETQASLWRKVDDPT